MRSTAHGLLTFALPLAALLGAAPASRAQATVESVLTTKFTVETVFPVAGREPALVAVRVDTKTLLSELAEKYAPDARRLKLVVRRQTALPGSTDPDFTAGDAVLIADGEETPLDPSDFLIFQNLAVAGVASTVQGTVLRDAALRTRTTVTVRGLSSGDLAAPPVGNAQEFVLVAVETAVEKMVNLRVGGQATLFSKRALAVTGAAKFNVALPGIPAGFPEDGAVSGTITLSGEKQLAAP